MPSVIQSFTGKYAFLSLLYRSAFFFDTDQYNSPAAAFEAAKILSRNDRVSFIGWNIQPWDARRLGKNIPKSWMRPDWEAVQLDIMLDIQRSKFSWPLLREKLLAIEDAQLVHGNACHDNFWGVCLCQSLPASKQKYGVSPRCAGDGGNRLGLILMQVRQECHAGHHRTPVMPK
jgi:ribA/ribD-fused uncharacterized protein